ncbi:MarR family transcriptional regulator [Candidatus Woesearchaeota archaeon]|nr:MarR family transcriptional regulator [Candidatus Woesearchaeota archaeon]
MDSRKLGGIIVIISLLVLGLMLFMKVKYDQQQAMACIESCGGVGVEACGIDSCPYAKETPLSWIPIIASLFAASLCGIGLYLWFSKKEKVIEQKEYDLSKLDGLERKAFQLIREQRTGLYQKDLAGKLGLSRVKVTRVLDRLELYGLVERKRRGMTNVVVLK